MSVFMFRPGESVNSSPIPPEPDTPAAPQTRAWKGRGALSNPNGRFESTKLEREIDFDPEEESSPKTEFIKDATQTIITYNTSPDVGFNASINAYRGCEHGCVY